jgi:hypothetical protein
MLLDIIHRPVFIQKQCPVYFSKRNVSESGFCLCLLVKPTQLGPINRASPYLQLRGKVRNGAVPVAMCLQITLVFTLSYFMKQLMLLTSKSL